MTENITVQETHKQKPLQLTGVAGVCHIDSAIDYLFKA